MGRYSLKEFVDQTGQRDLKQGFFELERDRLLEVNLSGMVWTKMGSMVSYQGQIKFTREGIFEQGLGNFFKKAFTGEGSSLTRAEGVGKLYLADSGKKVSVLQLDGESICVNGNDVLAFESSLKYEIKMMKKIAGMLSGGLFHVRMEGRGMLAITSHYDPLTLRVQPGQPVFTDPNATVAWSGGLNPQLHTDMSLKTFFGRGSGESFQMRFDGTGFVVVQPFEEVYFQQTSG